MAVGLGAKRRSLWQMAKQALQDGGPGMCQFALTSACNARCSFCNFAVDKMPIEQRQAVTLAQAQKATEILYRNGVYFLIYVGGEPLMHPDLDAMIAHATQIGMSTMIVTNGALLTIQRVEQLAAAGLQSAIISIDAANVSAHEGNRGLRGVCDRIRTANQALQRHHINSTASVTMSRLVDDYSALPPFLQDLGFDSVTFSYPLTTLSSSYLGFGESELVSYTPEELHERFEAIKALKREFHVVNPTASIADMQRHLRQEPEQFGCLAGWKYFYLDWELNLFRCNNWAEPMCHIDDFDGSQRVRDGCTACTVDCYRDSSVMQHIGMAVSDGLQAAGKGQLGRALQHWFDRRNLISLQAVWEDAQWIRRL
jgi:MoaA/NifB/PqqE/SkfB family radical SAM enzyme